MMNALTTECYSIMFISISNIVIHKYHTLELRYYDTNLCITILEIDMKFTMLGISNNNTLVIQLSHVGLSAKHRTYAGTGPAAIAVDEFLQVPGPTSPHPQVEPVVTYPTNIKCKENKRKEIAWGGCD